MQDRGWSSWTSAVTSARWWCQRRRAWPAPAVIDRTTGIGTQHCAVYPGLRRGRYDLWLRPDQPTALTVTVHGALVTWVDWPQ